MKTTNDLIHELVNLNMTIKQHYRIIDYRLEPFDIANKITVDPYKRKRAELEERIMLQSTFGGNE